MAIREDICDAIKAGLETITTSNGYSISVKLVEFAARDWAELKVTHFDETDRVWFGIVSQGEIYRDLPGIVETTWTIALVAHIRIPTRTDDSVITTVSGLSSDVRKLFYNDLAANLGVAGVQRVRIMRRADSIGHPEGTKEQVATSEFHIDVKFQERRGA